MALLLCCPPHAIAMASPRFRSGRPPRSGEGAARRTDWRVDLSPGVGLGAAMTIAPATDEDQAALRLAAQVPDTALCTIVGIDGSYSRRRGAQLAVAPDGRMAGSLADGCLEKELAAQAEAARG